jgi:hypothetical protein
MARHDIVKNNMILLKSKQKRNYSKIFTIVHFTITIVILLKISNLI